MRILVSIAVCAALLAGAVSAEAQQGQATPVEQIKLPPDFKIELLYTVPREAQGSWVSLTVDDRGRLIASDQYGALYRIQPASSSQTETKVEKLDVDIGMAQGLLYAFDSLYVMVNGTRGRQSGLYRVRDTDGDDQFDEVKLLQALDGSGEHGPHAIILSPDKKSLYLAAGNHTNLPEIDSSRVPRNWQEDQLLPRMWDANGHAVGRLAPGGFILRTDPEGKELELVSSGYRNQYDIAFNPAGELFTYDADMEWDIGTPWYRPTRVLHATSGSEFGWRSGTGKWPEYYPDSLPAVVDIGPGSPTGITFGTGAKFPAKYQQALFLCDWSYGVIYAAHLQPEGASYSGTLEVFATAAPLPVTDIVVNPQDGALYFAIGGRNAQSALYRVTYAGNEPTSPAPQQLTGEAAQLQSLRHQLEQLHQRADSEQGARKVIETAWPHLAHADRFVRYAARIAIEHQPVEVWQERALQEQDPQSLIEATIALARNGEPQLQPQIVEALGRIQGNGLREAQKLDLVRAYQLVFARLGEPAAEVREAVVQRLNPMYPAKSTRLNRELSQVLAYLEAPGVVEKTLELLVNAPTQEEQIHYALVLRTVDTGWTLEQRRQYFSWFPRAMGHRGGMSFGGFIRNIREEARVKVTTEHGEALKELIEQPLQPQTIAVAETPRAHVQSWTVSDLLPEVEKGLNERDFARGQRIFAEAQCFKCHRFAGVGGSTGPDLTGVGRRFNDRDLLESVIEPSKVVSDQYESHTFLLEDGRTITGRIINLSGNDYMVLTNMLDPSSLTSIDRNQVEELQPAKTSLMPSGLLDTFNRDEILDLIAYLKSGGDPDHAVFAGAE